MDHHQANIYKNLKILLHVFVNIGLLVAY